MSIFKTLFGKKSGAKSGWAVKPAAERPSAWSEPKAPEQPIPAKRAQEEANPFLDDAMLDTMQLEAETLHEDNPYQTHSWEMDPDSDTRKLRTIPFGRTKDKKSAAEGNPYETGEHRRSWKD